MNSMKEMFGQHHGLTEAESAKLWNECIFSLDANVLLNIYRYSDNTRNDLFKVLEGMRDRIWITHQAAKEFYKNRIDVIREQKAKFAEIENYLQKAIGDLRGGKFLKSAFLQIGDLEAILKPAVDAALARISAQKEHHPDLLHADPYLEKLASLVGASIGSEIEASLFEESCTRAQERIDRKQPPGYADDKKPIPERYGDVLLWFELLEYGKSSRKSIVFITDDKKEDWWHIVAGETLGPRPELREEMRKVANVQFHLSAPSYFLQQAAKQLEFNVSQTSVSDLAEVTAEASERSQLGTITPRGSLRKHIASPDRRFEFQEYVRAEEAVADFVHREFPYRVRRETSFPFDFVLEFEGEPVIGLDVIVIRAPRPYGLIFRRLEEKFFRAHFQLSQNLVRDYWLFVVFQDRQAAEECANRYSKIQLAPAFNISFGFLNLELGYQEVGRYMRERSIYSGGKWTE